MAKKYYAVAFGKEGSGIYTNWDETEANVNGVSGVKYKSFPGLKQAREFLLEKGVGDHEIQLYFEEPSRQKTVSNEPAPPQSALKAEGGRKQYQNEETLEDILATGLDTEEESAVVSLAGDTVYAYVDGSFRQGYDVYGYGVVIVSHDQVVKSFSGAGCRSEYVTMRNVAGEVLGAVKAMEYAVSVKAEKLVLYFDYQGIESWARGTWKRNNNLTRGYHEFVRTVETRLKIDFMKVKGHSGDQFNDLADVLAKQAVLDSRL